MLGFILWKLSATTILLCIDSLVQQFGENIKANIYFLPCRLERSALQEFSEGGQNILALGCHLAFLPQRQRHGTDIAVLAGQFQDFGVDLPETGIGVFDVFPFLPDWFRLISASVSAE